jgi:hypothetical protein
MLDVVGVPDPDSVPAELVDFVDVLLGEPLHGVDIISSIIVGVGAFVDEPFAIV